MRIGINYKTLYDICIILYALQDEEIVMKGSGLFEIPLTDKVLVFSKKQDDIKHCDKRINLIHNDPQSNTDDPFYNQYILSVVEDPVAARTTDEMLSTFLSKNNHILTGGTLSFDHANVIFNPYYNFVFFNDRFGYKFLNYYHITEKTQLIGVYYNVNQKDSSTGRKDRIELMTRLSDEVPDSVYAFPMKYRNIDHLINSYEYLSVWYNVNATTYTDYMTAACNIIFETGNESKPEFRTHLSEKTTKAIMFSEANIFFIWYGSEYFYQCLKNTGFWFLNFEFYDETIDDVKERHRISVIRAAQYVSDLNKKLGSPTEVHKYLLESYGLKLNNNIRLMNETLSTCPEKDRIINILTS